jgi:hypothetical protein
MPHGTRRPPSRRSGALARREAERRVLPHQINPQIEFVTVSVFLEPK